ncbi:hypothetical protein CONPUDRAFT_167541 [Coniophora puteana RWD-64-598 SS2]|uniref:F-box domain-containing protein n=1 Tax=Coniophora puteana (strain RWD-64-598) TaxID=741705 RepID=A0A5M3MIV4_CONPW|nr:uncharacterized protein CONPUDRAFT_167541 [Coniophora puteana RWD-64-598 SS2]EIW78551.1 hypothetical protein CONPUDRAFT_167541 [Coniophora puteana RWD-64-598 SS2]
MHAALQIAEIQQVFCSQMSTVKSLAALARTCKTLKEPALDCLWSGDLEPIELICLIKVLKPVMEVNLWRTCVVADVGLTTGDDWMHAMSYTTRVRVLHLSVLSEWRITEHAIRRLWSSSSTIEQVFPKLRSLVVDGINSTSGPASWSLQLHCDFFFPNSSALTLEFSEGVDPEFWRLLPERSPRLKSLAVTPPRDTRYWIISDGHPEYPMVTPLSRAVEQLRLLEYLKCPDLENDALLAVSQLPGLEYLSLWEKEIVLPYPTMLQFPALRVLDLVQVNFRDLNDNAIDFLYSLETIPETVVMKTLTPLFRLHRLKEINIPRWDCQVDFSDDDLAAMMTAWPGLENLWLGGRLVCP